MEGAYVDTSFSLLLIVADCVDNEGDVMEWTVYCNTCHVKLSRSSTSPNWITCNERRGCYDGVGRIVWDDPNLGKWTRINISSLQWHFLIHRPYVPLTVVLFAMLRHFGSFVLKSCQRLAKAVNTETFSHHDIVVG